MAKKYSIEELKVIAEKGIKVKRYNASDLMNLIERGKMAKFDEVILPRSMETDKAMNWEEFTWEQVKGNRCCLTDDVIFVDYKGSQKTEEEIIKKGISNAQRKEKDYAKKIETLREEIPRLEEQKKAVDNSYKNVAKKKNALSKIIEAKGGDLTELTVQQRTDWVSLNKEFDKISKERLKVNNELKNKKKDISDIIALQEKNIEYKSNLLEKEIIDNGVHRTEEELREALYNGFTLDKEIYSDGLNKKIKEVNKRYDKLIKDGKLTSAKLKNLNGKRNSEIRTIIESNEDEITRLQYNFKRVSTTSSKTRQGKSMFMVDSVVDTKTGEVVREGLATKWSNSGTLGAYDVYVEKGKRNEFGMIVENDAYGTMSQSAIVDDYMEIKPENIFVMEDVNVDVKAYGKETTTEVFQCYYNNDDGKKIIVKLEDTEKVERVVNGNKVVSYYSKETGEELIPDTRLVVGKEGVVDTKNVMWDGQSLLDKSYFKGRETSFALLRNEEFKSCGFNWNVQEQLKDLCEANGLDYNTYEITDKYGIKHKVKDIKMITTDNSTKFDKFAKELYPELPKKEAQAKHYETFCKEVKEFDNRFAVVKTEHASKYGDLQQSSYQMINSLDMGATKQDVSKSFKEILKDEIENFNKMKNSDVEFISYMEENADEFNGWKMYLQILEKNPEYKQSQSFRELKKSVLSQYKSKVSSGKLKVVADNYTMCSNPSSMVKQALGLLPVERREDGELYLIKDKFENEFGSRKTDVVKMYANNLGHKVESACFRSPHTSDANIVVSQNVKGYKDVDDVFKYANGGKNVIYVDSTEFAIQDTLAGCDFDSDFLFMTQNPTIVSKVKENSWQKKPITVNKVKVEKSKLTFNAHDLALKDITAAENHIGEIVNLGQIAQSHKQHLERNLALDIDKMSKEGIEESKEMIKELSDVVTKLDCMSGLAIDSAKRKPELNIGEELNRIKEEKCFIRKDNKSITKPEFFTNVSQSANVKTSKLDCNMDILTEVVDTAFKNAPTKIKIIDDSEFIEEVLSKKVNKKKVRTLLDDFKEYSNRINRLYANLRGAGTEEAKDIYRLMDVYNADMKRKLRGINQEEMKQLVAYANGIGSSNKVKVASGIKRRMQNMLWQTDKNKFINCYKAGEGVVNVPSLSNVIEEANSLMEDIHKYAEIEINASAIYHKEMIDELNRRVERVYVNATKDMTEDEIKKFLNGTMSKEEMIKFNAKGYEARISRLEVLKNEVDKMCGEARDKANDRYTNLFSRIIDEAYNRTMFSIQSNTHIAFDFSKPDEDMINTLLNKETLGMTYWDRNNAYYQKLADSVQGALVEGLGVGASMYRQIQIIKEASKYTDYEAYRLLRTETTHFANQVELQAYEDSGIDKYVYIATLDENTSTICREHDGKVYNRKDAKEGVNFPTLHVNCRCTTIAYFDDETLQNMQRRCRNSNGEWVIEDKFLNYEEWLKKYGK